MTDRPGQKGHLQEGVCHQGEAQEEVATQETADGGLERMAGAGLGTEEAVGLKVRCCLGTGQSRQRQDAGRDRGKAQHQAEPVLLGFGPRGAKSSWETGTRRRRCQGLW